ncbi:chemotaxis protein CheC [Halopelagius longus]|uniref:Chemotaxis protein CheC n=1 Tax=Halopelagius longus TaxID=1236180 RepID=A0A1H1BFN4_9EURY|nr:chemotaxis protein CheC [Halopelagius longus]RDI70768.1 chemotaxis protein CheX [Halopelagius longus]SDQ50701.1 chemotaxis protein CheC [Halopelagius longus]
MNLDVQSLRTFSRLAHSGAERAAGSLTQLTGVETSVNVTKIEVSTRGDVEREFVEQDLVSVHIGFNGGIDGRTVLAFDRDKAVELVDVLVPGAAEQPDGEMATSGLKELGNIMLGGFIDGWADFLETSIDITTPTFVDVESQGALDDITGDSGFEMDTGEDHVLAFRNQLETADEKVNFQIYMLPTHDSIETISTIAGSEGKTVPVESFTSFSEMITDGAEQASEDLTAMTGSDTTVEVSRLSFVPIEAVPMELTEETRLGVVLEFEGLPSGYIAILFDEESADNLAESLMPGMEADAAMRQSAIQEIGNITTSGFLDGWANALETTIEISPPTYVEDLGSAIIDPLATELAQSQEHAFLIDSTIVTDDDEFTCDIYALPNEAQLREALNRLAAEA